MATQLDLNDLDSLSRTCRGVHNSLLQNRPILLKSTLHCSNEDLPVDPESTLRYRARAGNWYYMEDTARTGSYNGKAGSCARDMVAKCRKCSTVVCRVKLSLSLPTASAYTLGDRQGTNTELQSAELCDKTTSPCRHARQTPPALHPLPEAAHRPPRQAAPGPRRPPQLRSDAASSMHMRDRRCLALPALRPRDQGCRLRISRVRFHPLFFFVSPLYADPI